MRRATPAALGLAFLFLLAGCATHVAAQAEPVRIDRDTDCRWNSDRDTYCEEREYVIPARGMLEVDAGQNGGIQVHGWDRDEIRVIARVQAWSRYGDDAREIADGIDIHIDGRVHARGDQTGRRTGWAVSFDVMVPRAIELRLDAQNGGIDLAQLTGYIEARTTNGGISLVGGEGRVRGETTNGGLEIELTGETWVGGGVDLETTNGGVEIRVPRGFNAELETGTVNGGMEIDFPIMIQGRINRTLRTELGEGGPLIRARTTNGGVVLRRG